MERAASQLSSGASAPKLLRRRARLQCCNKEEGLAVLQAGAQVDMTIAPKCAANSSSGEVAPLVTVAGFPMPLAQTEEVSDPLAVASRAILELHCSV